MHPLKLNTLLFIDLEINPTNNKIFKIGALLVNNFQQENVSLMPFEQEIFSESILMTFLKKIDHLSTNIDCLVGHNIIEHDLPILKKLAPDLSFLNKPIIDTLQLSPLAFPKNPYHRLLKDYKLIRSELNSPLQDCESTYTLLQEQLEAFYEFSLENMGELRCYQSILEKDHPTYASLLKNITQLPCFNSQEFKSNLLKVLKNNDQSIDIKYKVCITELTKWLVDDIIFEHEIAFSFLYTLSWLRVSGSNSVLAPWVRYQFPETSNLITMLRDTSCNLDSCDYCSNIHNPRKELQRYFHFNDFRYEDYEKNESIQRDIVEIGMRDENIFAILPTGGGKSLCYQLPALNRFFRNGSLTIIISPLQALMKDQVDGLISKNIYGAAALNGLLSAPERADVLEKIQMGDIGILFVSPEQFRSSRFKRAIEHRQIGAWIYDEAHCLSKWGNDFRPDYLYVAKCIKELNKTNRLAPIGCFTATAKQEVIDDIKEHFKETLDVDFIEKISLKDRPNLDFNIIECEQHEKTNTISTLLSEYISDQGGAIIFVSRRKAAEDIAKQLKNQNWNCEYFHAGLPANEKKDIQNAFISGEIKVIVSTNAFGMGVDKEDVRLVIHADIPGSLENYLQEAGRAGRDQKPATCILLYSPNDVEVQFRLTEYSKLTRKEMSLIYKKLRMEQEKRKSADLIITPREILKDSLIESIDIDDDNAKTKIITAIAWLERDGYLERTDNVVRIFPSHLKIHIDQAITIINESSLSIRKKEEYICVVKHISNSPPDKIIEVDILSELISSSLDEVSDILHELQNLKILTNNTLLTAYIRHGIQDTSQKRLELNLWCETTLLELLSEYSPDIESGHWQNLDLALLCHQLDAYFDNSALRESLDKYLVTGKIMPPLINKIFKVLCEDKASPSEENKKNLQGHKKILEMQKNAQKDSVRLKVNGHYSWQDIKENGAMRRLIASKIVKYFIAKVSGNGKDLLVETTFEELQNHIFSDIILAEHFKTPEQQKAIIHNALLYLHNLQIITLNHGMTVMRNALTIKVDRNRQNRYLAHDYSSLEKHYKELRLQVHVMREYAEIGLTKLQEALRFILDYFSMTEPQFIRKYFKGREKILAIATSEESLKNIVGNLSDVQRQIVESTDENHLILAGPGSGKTRVIVHRIAYLLRVERIPPQTIIALAYNRSAANEIRKRLFDLVGNESYGVTVMTYHSIAMRLTGTVYSNDQLISLESEKDAQDIFKTMLKNAIEMLREEDTDLTSSEDDNDTRAKLLQGYRYILVDEYQDIDEDQYNLISALAGRNSKDEDGKLTILAVGDDDQNIYTFRGSSNQYIDKFTEDYNAKISYLVENYRSTQGIIQASNDVIQHNPNRLKSNYPIVINHERQSDLVHGRWELIDQNGRAGQVVVRFLTQKNYEAQAYVVLTEIKRLYALDPDSINSCAILARSKKALETFSGGLATLNFPHYYEHDKSNHFSTPNNRYFQNFIHEIESAKDCKKINDIQCMIHWEQYPERWVNYFIEVISQLNITFNHMNIDIKTIIQWIYDYVYEIPITIKQGIFLGTMHSAKGLEFNHVFILDDLDNYFDKESEEERRLFYVGMTRAKETLMLCSFNEKHHFIQSITNSKNSIVNNIKTINSLQQKHILLSPKDIYMDYLGSQSNEVLQKASLTLMEGSPLLVEKMNDRLVFKKPDDGQIVAQSSKNCKYNHIDLKEIIECTVHSISQRNMNMINADFKNKMKCDTWEVIQPRIILSSLNN